MIKILLSSFLYIILILPVLISSKCCHIGKLFLFYEADPESYCMNLIENFFCTVNNAV